MIFIFRIVRWISAAPGTFCSLQGLAIELLSYLAFSTASSGATVCSNAVAELAPDPRFSTAGKSVMTNEVQVPGLCHVQSCLASEVDVYLSITNSTIGHAPGNLVDIFDSLPSLRDVGEAGIFFGSSKGGATTRRRDYHATTLAMPCCVIPLPANRSNSRSSWD